MQRTLIPIGPLQVLGFCLAISAFELLTYLASDLIMPAMLTVTTELQADVRHVPNAFNLYLLGGVCLQWLIGPLSDALGRRRPLIAGLVLHVLASILCVVAPTVGVLGALRVVQALLAHVRLDADPDAVSEAEFDALHP